MSQDHPIAKPELPTLPRASSYKVTLAAPTLHTQHLRSLVHIDTDLLPPVVRDWVRLIGEADAVALVRHAGGTKVVIPAIPDEAHALAHLVSGKSWHKLCAVYGQRRPIQIPKCTNALIQLRNARMVADADLQYKQTKTINYNELCIKYGLTNRQCEKIVSKSAHQGLSDFIKKANGGDTRTLDLF